MSHPLFTIAIPAFKSSYLGECIESVLNQSYKDFELLIIDDCSPEDLKSIVLKYEDARIRYYRNEKGFGAVNVVGNWNKCLEYAKGDFIICMGDDDKLKPNFLADCRAAKAGAEAAEADAIAKALVSEGWAKGTQNGVPVTSGSPYYEDNAKYYKDQASSIVGSKVDSFNGRTGIVLPASGDYSQDMIAVPTGSSNGQVPTVRTVGGVKTFVMEQASVGLLPHLIILSDTSVP